MRPLKQVKLIVSILALVEVCMTITSCQITYASDIVQETANSYIMPPNGFLRIPVNVRGNGGDVANTGISTRINPSSVGILWQTSPNLIVLGEIGMDKKVNIISSSKSGNAVIAAYSGEHQTGNILWSWHIWVTDYNPDTGKTCTIINTAGASYTFMDRDLGATTSTPGLSTTLGLLYQWGRKDPFPRSYSAFPDIEPILYNVFGIGDISIITKESVSEVFNLKNTIMHPLTFYTGSDWYSTSIHNDALWGGADIRRPSAKTIFDPCPAGWRVPPWKGSASPWSAFTTENFLWSDKDQGRTYNGAFYPSSDMQYGVYGALSSVGFRDRYWSAASYCNTGYYLLFNKFGVDPQHNTSKSFGFSVRCVKN